VTEVRALYGRFSLRLAGRDLRVATHATVGSGRGWPGAVVARPAMGATGGARRLQAF